MNHHSDHAECDLIFSILGLQMLFSLTQTGRYFILLDIVDPRTESNPNPNPNPNPDPNCGFTISHEMKYLRSD